ncbi:hypothetical protein ACB092_11G244000 [Castanea dentata]
MAESIIYGVAQTIIESLGSQIFQEIGKICGVEKEIEKLKGTVSRIQAILKDAEEQQHHNHQVKDWLEKLKGAVDEANDLLSKYGTKTPKQKAGKKITKEVRNFFSNSNQIAYRFNMNEKLKKIRQKLDAIVKDSEDFKLKVIPMEREEDAGDQHVRVPGTGLSTCTTVAAAEDLDKEKID